MWIHATNKESKSRVICKTRQKPYLERKLSNCLSSLLFHSKVSSSLLFHSKLPLFYSKIAFFLIETIERYFFTFSKLSSLLLFHWKLQVCHFYTNLFGFSLFQLTLSSTLLLPFFNRDGLATVPFKTVDFVTLIRSFSLETIKLATFYSKLSSSLLSSI